MWRHYLTVVLRSIRRAPLYTLIKVGSLTLGLACCILLLLFVQDEWTYDQFHADADRIYRVNTQERQPNGGTQAKAYTPVPLAPELATTTTGIDRTVRLREQDALTVQRGSDTFDMHALVADSSFFDVFSFPLLRGQREEVLRRPDGVVLARDAAERLFGDANPIGQSLSVVFDESDESATLDATVVGVVAPPPSNSSIQFEMLLPFAQFARGQSALVRNHLRSSWTSNFVSTYVRLAEGAAAADVAPRVSTLLSERAGPEASTQGAALQNITAIHLDPSVEGGLTPARSPTRTYILGGIALLVLLIAGINFTTLTLGQSARRLQAIGVRKSIGAQRGQIRSQFWGEAVLISAVATVLGVGAALLFLPTFNRLAEKALSLDVLLQPTVMLGLGGLAVLAGLLAGAYPAAVVARLDPVRVLKGHGRPALGRGLTRVLMVGQLALSIGLVAGAFVMNQQIQYMKTKDLGFDEEQVLTLKTGVNTQEGGAIYDAFRQEAQRLSNVAGVTGALFTPSSGSGNLTGTLRTPGGAEQQVHMNIVDSNYVDVMGIGMVTGRSFPAGASSRNVLVNQALVDALGWTDPVGRTLPTAERGGMGNRIIQDATVAGVVENFHFQPLRKQIQPLVLLPRSVAGGGVSHVAVRLQPGAPSDALDALRQVWSDVAPDLPFDYRFVDDALDAQYRAEERWQSIVGYAAGLALLIAALGLFGLATLAAARRTREIGIRKALGASIASILGLFSRDLAWGVGLALVLATPAAYFALQSWLDTFAYRITLDGTAFALAGGVTLLVALLSIAVQAIRAAQTDPARALRSE